MNQHHDQYEQRFHERLRRLAKTQKAPPELRARVIAALNAETDLVSLPRRARRTRVAAVTGLLAAAAIATLLLLPREQTGQETAVQFVASALAAPGERVLNTEEPGELGPWLAEQIGVAFEIPDIPDAQLTGGRVTDMGGIRSAAVEYSHQGRQLIYLMVPTTGPVATLQFQEGLASLSARGHRVVIWTEGSTARAVVASMPHTELQAIAEHCRSKRMI